MTTLKRCGLCAALLTLGLAARAGLERMDATERPPLRRPLASLPMELDGWAGRDVPVPLDVIERAQTTEYLNREYESRRRPGLKLMLWINYSEQGTNLRHTPEICLPSSGWTKIESQTRELQFPAAGGRALTCTRLGYAQGDLVKHVGFWYYIFGEGRLENFVRRLPVTSRSSHGRTTRGSSMTVEVFYPGDVDPDAVALGEFARGLLAALEPVLPPDRAEYHVP
ncbi:EpsI family protein [Paludisphaera mucosa]|uniref:EpsI family protein n=1 Tax=Paludisphaera mucosa TaxID=3030827 RepID=A0ABT6FJ65_9BACT|nr:EpsI family protein [Paludisphaera mucosa]MDG3007592.1 EpsI family protein [Paludisphaera mucosa]